MPCAKLIQHSLLSYTIASALQTASGIIFWEYERQRGKDLARAAKEKAFQEANDEDKRVSCLQESDAASFRLTHHHALLPE